MSLPRFTPHVFVALFLFAVVILPFSVTAGTSGGQKTAYPSFFEKRDDVKPDTLLAQREAFLSSSFYEGSTASSLKERESSAWEKLLAQQLMATGQTLGSSGDVSSTLLQSGQSLLPDGVGETQGWVQDKLRGILPQTDHKMALGALNAATSEIARGTSNMASGYAMSQVGLSDKSDDASGNLNQMALRSGLEGVKGAAAASSVYALNHLELEYGLSGSGIDEYSALTVQPLWDSQDLRHNVFAQGSYTNKKMSDTWADTNVRRDTVNAGLAYRYITSDKQHMFGVNTFFDHQWPYHHGRMSLGLDYKTSLYGVAFNKYASLSDWRLRADGYEEKALGGEDLEFSGRLPQAPELEVFVKGYHWAQEKTAVLNPDGTDIWGYQLAAEYTPLNVFSIRSEVTKDNDMDNFDGQINLRLNYTFGQSWGELWDRPSHYLDSVVAQRFEKVRRTNEIRVQMRQDPKMTARVTFAQGANVSAGQSLAFNTVVTTNAGAGNGVTVVFDNSARLDLGQSAQVRIESDKIVLLTGILQFTSGTGGIKVIAVPGGTINLIGTDVDVRVAGGTTTLRVRDGAADFADEIGTTRVNEEELAESQSGDSAAPQLRAANIAIFETHTSEAHDQLNLVGPIPVHSKAAPYVKSDVSVTGTMEVDQTLTFTVPLSSAVNITGSPRLSFTLGGQDRLALYASGSGTTSLVFTYVVTNADETLSTIQAQNIEKNGGTLTDINGAPMVLTVSGSLAGTVPDVINLTITALTAVSSGGDPAGTGDVITFTLDATETLVQSGTPTLTLDIGGTARTANFSAINAGNAEFTYTIQVGENDADGIDVTAINAAANELEDAIGNDLDTTLALPQNMGLNVVLDVTAPTITGLTAVSSGSDPSETGDVITFTLDATETLVQSGTPTLTLNVGGVSRIASFSVINAGNALFTYTVQAGDSDTDGIAVTAINAAANELEDASGNDLDTTLALPQNMGLNILTLMGLATCPAGDLTTPTNAGCARLIGADPTSLNDVMVYAGNVPGTATDFFVRRCDIGMTWDGSACAGARSLLKWKDVNTQSATTDIAGGTVWTDVNATNGPGNTALLVADASGVHAAAASCNALPGGGWYLPAISELDVMYANLIGTDDPDHPLPTVKSSTDDDHVGTTGILRSSINILTYYWSSSEMTSNRAWVQRFQDGSQAYISKILSCYVRCARR